jgi:LacI family transcriptional regulator
MRPTVFDIAERAGVSLATVDRVLNGRAGVRPQTASRVAEAVAALGYVRDVAAANLAKSRRYGFVFIVPEGPNSFMGTLRDAVLDAAQRGQSERIRLDIVPVPPFDAAAIVAALDRVDTDTIAGVALVATQHPDVEKAVARLTSAGICVVTVVSDLPNSKRTHYVGIDNIAAGRTAAGLLGRFVGARQGKLAVIAGSLVLRDHAERWAGFSQVIGQHYTRLEVLPVIEARDDAATVEALLGACLDRHRDVVGIYSLGAGNRGLIRVLETRRRGDPISVVAHELSSHARAALVSGTFDAIINQDAGHEVRSAVRVMKAHADRLSLIDGQERIRIDIFMRDNLP